MFAGQAHQKGKRQMIAKYLYRVCLALSVLLNVVMGGASNQTFSARNWQWKKEGRWNIVWMIDRILGKGHCVECWVWWKTRRW